MMSSANTSAGAGFAARVLALRQETADVLSFAIGADDGADLPSWEPGAHIDVTLPSGLTRQYSLCGAPANRKVYEIAVLREAGGRGGSLEMHDRIRLGELLVVGGPRNNFKLVEAAHYSFVAGGIGVTPIIPMIEEIHRRGGEWRLLYAARSKETAAFRDRLGDFGGRVEFSFDDEAGPPNLRRFLADGPANSEIYCCGPEGLIAAVEAICAGLSGRELHLERFTGEPLPLVIDDDDEGFEVELRRSKIVLRVPPTQRILEAVRQAGVKVPYTCETGVCGACETAVIEGTPMHRDRILTPKERSENKTMMICVGRSLSKRLVLDL